jgi:hypothetical protein
MQRTLVIAAVLFSACGGGAPRGGGGGGSGGGNSFPTTHVLDSNDLQNIASGGYYGVSFTLPTSADVSYDLTDQGSNDTWIVGIFSQYDYTNFTNGMSSTAIAPHNNVSTISDSATVDAGNWVLGVKCTNFIEHCPFTLGLSATF